jgi:hypothetical protein
LVAGCSTLKIDAVVLTRDSARDRTNVVISSRCFNVGGNLNTDRRIDVHVCKVDVEGLGVRGDGCPADLVVFAEIEVGSLSRGGDLEGEG